MLLAAVGMASARRWGGRVLLAPHRAPSVRTGVVTEGWPAQGLSRGRSAPSAVSRSHWSGSQWETLVSYVHVLGPPTEEASLLLELANIRFAACVPFCDGKLFSFGSCGHPTTNRCESTGVCRRGFVSRILTHTHDMSRTCGPDHPQSFLCVLAHGVRGISSTPFS